MISSWVVILSALLYLCALFAIAHYGDTSGRGFVRKRARSAIYALSIGVYCTSLTFFGSVGVATSAGLDFLPIYIGPFIAFVFCRPLIGRMIRIAKSQNITSIADFVSARYGKSEAVAAMVAIVAVIAGVPYIALQLKALTASLSTVLQSLEIGHPAAAYALHGALPSGIALTLAGFAMAFGTRRVDATEHQDGLVLAIATESVIKLAAFLIVGLYVTFDPMQAAQPIAAKAAVTLSDLVGRTSDPMTFLTGTFLSFSAILLLPRQFHVTVVENRDERDLRTAGWLFPIYLVAINLFVLPIAQAGLTLFPTGNVDRDMTVLTVPIAGQNSFVMLAALIGGLSAAAAMVIVSSVALSIMVSNDLVMPLLVRRRSMSRSPATRDVSARILLIRRVAIIAVLALSYVYYTDARDLALTSIGLMSFAAIAQIMPAFLAAFVWSRGTARGAMAGLCVGIALWAYTLFLPSFDHAVPWFEGVVLHGPFGIAGLRPTALFGSQLPSLTHGVVWSLALNIVAFVAVSLMRRPTAIETLQASAYFDDASLPIVETLRRWGATVTDGDLETTVSRYLGAEQTRRAFDDFLEVRGRTRDSASQADVHILEFAERLLASGIGAASSRLVLALLLQRGRVSARAAFQLLDDAATAIHHNRDLLQHAIDHARQGIAVIDKDLRLICWNREFRDLFNLPPELLRVGVGLDDIIGHNAERGMYGPGPSEQIVAERIERLTTVVEPSRLRLYPSGKVIEIRSAQMPDGGTVTTYTDVTESVAFQASLEAANESLEQRVRERTEELVRLNTELAAAKASADDANASKTRFLAAASHDILQPLNAARLYTTSLVERMASDALAGASEAGRPAGRASLAHNIDASLEAVEEILTALLDISRLDGGRMRIERSNFRIDDVLHQLALEFGPSAAAKGIDLRFVGCSATVRTDRRMLRRALQNLVSNAIKYTPEGRVVVGCRRRGKSLAIQVWDTGIGIAPEQQKAVFREFERLEQGARVARGLGLGLSIVERLALALEHRVWLKSHVGAGSMFGLDVPVVASLPAAAAAPAPVVSTVARPFAGMCVLAIDNEPRILDGMEALLGGWGCLVIKAESLEQAEAALTAARRAPDVVVTDYHLDAGDGVEAISALRCKFGSDLNAALLTADRSPEVREAAVAKGIQVLTKPLKPAALRALLSQWRVQRDAAE